MPATPTRSRFPFPAFPTGWYALCFSSELARGAVRALTFAGHERVLFRTASGRPAVVQAHCPHMGAHFGVGGQVRGEALRCPMHGFEFDAEGTCVKTAYGTRPPPACRAATVPLLEQSGLVLAFHDAQGHAPTWQPPPVDMRGYGPLRTALFAGLASHPQETTENSVDIGHLVAVHGYQDVEALGPLTTDGPYLTARYRIVRAPLLPGLRAVDAEITIHAHGLGHSFVDVDVRSYGLRTRHFVLATPTDGEHVDLRVAAAVAGSGALARLPARVLDRVLGGAAFRNFVADVQQDFAIWSNKIYVHPPALAQGDGPIGLYRRWARQFYAPTELSAEPSG